MTLTSFAEAAHHPCSLWISVEKATPLLAAIETAGGFSLAILHEGQQALAKQFLECTPVVASSGSELSLYKYGERHLFIADALACSACDVTRRIDFDDRSMFIADIVVCHFNSRRSHLRQLLTSDLS